MMLALIGIFRAQLVAKPERKEPTGATEKAKGEEEEPSVQRRNVPQNFTLSSLVQYEGVITSQRSALVCVFFWDSQS